jgi:ribonuclease E
MSDDIQVGSDSAASASEAAPAAKKAAAKKATAKKTTTKKTTAKKAPAKKAAAPSEGEAPPAAPQVEADAAPAKKAAAKKAAAKTATAKKTTSKKAAATSAEPAAEARESDPGTGTLPLFQAPEATKAPARRTRKTAQSADAAGAEAAPSAESAPSAEGGETPAERPARAPRKSTAKKTASAKSSSDDDRRRDQAADTSDGSDGADSSDDSADGGESDGEGGARRRRRRGGRRRRKPGEGGGDGQSEDRTDSDSSDESEGDDSGKNDDAFSDDGGGEGTSRRRRRRRRTGDDGGEGDDDNATTTTRVRRPRNAEDEITAISGSTRLEAKKQRRREGREAGRRRAPIVSEAEFLARRESVDRVMVVRQRDELTQIGVIEDKVLVEHYVARASQTSLIGNVYLGRVQNVLPSMEAAFIDIGKGRNAVLYAGEVNWSALGHRDGQPRKIESVLSSGQSVLVQVSKDPIGHKGARLTSQISLAGRFLVYVPDGTTSGISRKLPDTERTRLKTLLKEIVPDTAGVIVRTAAEGASEDELTRDVERLKARWDDIESKAKGSAPQLLYGEPDLTLKVVRDLFTEDISKLVIQGDDAWDTVQNYVSHVAPDLEERLERYEPRDHNGKDIFATYRVEEQIAKGLDRKVWLPSGGSLIIDRTEAMTVVDVNTGKFTGSGGNLEETVTKNNLEAAEEMVRQLRLRDIGGIIVIDFIDMVLESNRDLVLRRLVECLGRDRTRHQVAEVTSLGLVQMTRKRIGTGLVEAFSENCATCQGRGVVIHDHPVEPRGGDDESGRGGGRRGRGGKGRGQDQDDHDSHDSSDSRGGNGGQKPSAPTPKDVAAMARQEKADRQAAEAAERDEAPEPEPELAAVVEVVEAPVETAVDEAPAVVVEVAVPQPLEPAAPVEPAAPKVVTRTRRRSASRPAGQPEPVAVPVVEVAEPVTVPEPVTAPEPASTPEPPKVVTRTRGRSASRPAGPPASGPAESDGGAGTDVDGHEDGHPVEHVPIKKKGARKR